jgi:8-amino-3,8-dideoxy-alpha-D-manno-octulosonate transaminase
MTTTDTRLAIDGGTPVRAGRLPLGRGVAMLGEEEIAAVTDVLRSRSLFRYYGPHLGRHVEAFEQGLVEQLGVAHAVATSSGTAALRAALAALGVGCGDEVVVPAFTFIATVNAVVSAGAVPVFAEVDESLNLDPTRLEDVVSERTVALLPVHLENVGADMDPIMEVAGRHGLGVVEDAAQAIGSTYRGRALGTIGDLGAFSLQLEKNITSGEGGAVVTHDERLWLRAARFQDQGGQFVTSSGGGRGGELDEPFLGENLRMTEIAGAIATVQLGRLPGLLTSMRANKRRILDDLGDVPGLQPRRRPDPEGDGSSSIMWFAPDQAGAVRTVSALRAEGVPAVQLYDGRPVYANEALLARRTASNQGGPWHCAEHPCQVTYELGMCPRTEALAARNVTIGVGAQFDEADCADVAAAVRKVSRALFGR